MKYLSWYLFIGIVLASCHVKTSDSLSKYENNGKTDDHHFVNMYGDTIRKIFKTETEWKSFLNDLEYEVLRNKGTEPAFSGDLHTNKQEGLYTCRGCGMPLFSSKHKYDSGTGWPSFYEVLDNRAILMHEDHKLGYVRTELTCGKCGGHLGHVFDDGPKPTNKRYCINAVSLDFVRSESGIK